jgi:MFS family permease
VSPEQAPFIPPTPEEQPIPPAPWRVFGTRSYFKLWLAQCFSSLGDWVGLFAILAIATRVSNGSAAAVSLVMVARMVPGFFLATVGGVFVDRFDRRKVMVTCDIGRAGLLLLLPLIDTLLGLVVVSFAIEILTLLWSPAKDASVPNLVDADQLASANSLSLVAAYGTFPLGGIIFSLLAVAAKGLGSFSAFSSLSVDREVLALWVDGATFLTSAAIVWGLPIPHIDRSEGKPIDWTQTFREIVEGLRFIRSHQLVRGVMLGLGVGLIGGGAMVPLGPVFARDVLGSSTQFGVLMTALGMGAAMGIFSLLAVQRRLPRQTVFSAAVVGTGVFLILAASFSTVGLAALMTAGVGAGAGTAYVTGFTVLQENVSDELRGRIFATLYTVVRLCLLISLTLSPLFADLFEWLSGIAFGPSRSIDVAGVSYALPGVRLALWAGGLVTIAAGSIARRKVRASRRTASSESGSSESGSSESGASGAES